MANAKTRGNRTSWSDYLVFLRTLTEYRSANRVSICFSTKPGTTQQNTALGEATYASQPQRARALLIALVTTEARRLAHASLRYK